MNTVRKSILLSLLLSLLLSVPVLANAGDYGLDALQIQASDLGADYVCDTPTRASTNAVVVATSGVVCRGNVNDARIIVFSGITAVSPEYATTLHTMWPEVVVSYIEGMRAQGFTFGTSFDASNVDISAVGYHFTLSGVAGTLVIYHVGTLVVVTSAATDSPVLQTLPMSMGVARIVRGRIFVDASAVGA